MNTKYACGLIVFIFCCGHISSSKGLVWFNHTCYLGLLHLHCDDLTNALVPVKLPSRIWLKIAKTKHNRMNIDNLVQDCSNSSALAMELLQFCTKSQDIPHHAVQPRAHITSGFSCQFQIDGSFISLKCWLSVTKCCEWHKSCIVVTCTKAFKCIIINWLITNMNFPYWNWIAATSLVKRSPASKMTKHRCE